MLQGIEYRGGTVLRRWRSSGGNWNLRVTFAYLIYWVSLNEYEYICELRGHNFSSLSGIAEIFTKCFIETFMTATKKFTKFCVDLVVSRPRSWTLASVGRVVHKADFCRPRPTSGIAGIGVHSSRWWWMSSSTENNDVAIDVTEERCIASRTECASLLMCWTYAT